MQQGDQGTIQAEVRPEESVLRRVVLAGSIGHFVEWYDYGVYAYLAASIAVVFFPSDDPTAALLATFATFAVAFFVRPIGGVFCGYFGDKFGRQRTLAVVILLISGATLAIGLLPGYAAIGVTAPILLVLLRLLQGFSAGGEVAGANSFIAEYSPEGRRAFLTCWTQVGSFGALLFGSTLATVLAANLSEASLNSWAWRIPFLVAGPLGLVGLYIRLKLEDTPKFRALETAREVAQNPLRETFSTGEHYQQMGLTFGIALLNSSGYYVLFVYMPTYLSAELNFDRLTAFLSLTAALIVLIAAIPFMAVLSDRVGRKPTLAGSSIGLLVLGYPCFLLISQGGLFNALVGQVIMALLFAPYTAVVHATMLEMFPTRIRYSGYSVGYNISTAIFGGAAPFFITYLISVTGNDLVPAFYMVSTALFTLIAVMLITETAKVPLRDI